MTRPRLMAGVALLAGVAALVAGAQQAVDSRDRLDRPALVAPLASESLLLDIARAGERLVAVGERGHVLLSDDNGASWRQAKDVPSRTLLTAVWFADASHGWAVGHDEIILNSRDGGETWTRSHYAPQSQQPLLDVWFADVNRGIAVGAYGAYYTTADGGATWQGRKFEAAPAAGAPPPSPDDEFAPDYHLNRIAAAGGRLFIAAESGQIYRSDDQGASWRTLPSPYNGSFFGLLPLDGDSLLVFGLRGNLFRSDDAGQSWQALPTGTTAMLADGVRAADGAMTLVGLSGTVLRSADGSSWQLSQQDDRKGLSALTLTASGDLVAVGEGGAHRLMLAAATPGSAP